MKGTKLTTKERFLEVLHFFFTQTDEATGATIQDVVEHMQEKHGATVTNETVREDILTLSESEEFPIHECSHYQKGRPKCYYYAGRLLNVQQLRVLLDAVNTSPVIPKEERLVLMREIRRWTTDEKGERLKNDVWVRPYPTEGHRTFSSDLEKIHRAIHERKRLTFLYGHYTFVEGEVTFTFRHSKRTGQPRNYTIEPYEIYWHQSRYYLVGIQEDGKVRHYRLDRMRDVSLSEETFIRNASFEKTIRHHLLHSFHMYSGRFVTMTLRVDVALLSVFVDRFGIEEPTYTYQEEEQTFLFEHKVVGSQGLRIWLLSFGHQVEVVAPRSLRDEMKEEIQNMQQLYDD